MSRKYFHTICNKRTIFIVLLLCIRHTLSAQQQYELNTSWQCIRASTLNKTGEEISDKKTLLKGWMSAVVPGTVLTSLLHNKLIPDPFYGMNNKRIPDIYNVGRNYYSYWFVKEFTEKYPAKDEHVWLQFRGVNNSCDIFLNGHKINNTQYKSMYLRQEYDITPFLAKDGHNRLAIIVYPPNPVGNPNGGQGGDGTIAHNITNQYTAGWDWIQPVHDRNTGIWDKVFIKKTKQVKISNTHVITLVPGTRITEGRQAPAIIKLSTELHNTTNSIVDGTLVWELDGQKGNVIVNINPGTQQIDIPDIILNNPKLWWPNGYGKQNLYNIKIQFLSGNTCSDEDNVHFGVRQLSTVWNTNTKSREIHINGQKIFIKGGNWICSDAMLRCSAQRYDAEIHYHHDMNLNLIRVWGGGLTERPEFYDACDKYGLLVFQDFWVSGDCNGRWYDPLKSEDTTTRRNYPDDHQLLVASLTDQIKMLRNHPSLAIWCGGNEIRPPADVLKPLKDSILPQLDGTRFFFEYSNDDSMSYHSGDGPYTIQHPDTFWSQRSFPFNSEIGSVGIGDYESLQRFIPQQNLVAPLYDTINKKWKVDSVWQYHKYISYDSAIEAYGHPKDAKDLAMKAQLVNYTQYRSLIESFSAHMWDWYTGVIIWKTQNPWTAMVGQMYDVYLDPNACLYGLSKGAEPLHIMYNPVNKSAMAVNNKFDTAGIKVWARIFGKGIDHTTSAENISIPPQSSVIVHPFDNSAYLPSEYKNGSVFMELMLFDSATHISCDNIYALPDSTGSYLWLSRLKHAEIRVAATYENDSVIRVTITNAKNKPVSFFNHITLVDKKTKKRILPAFCNNNYISVLPGETRSVLVSYKPQKGIAPMISIEGWNLEQQYLEIKH